jgi:hypothetical protein
LLKKPFYRRHPGESRDPLSLFGRDQVDSGFAGMAEAVLHHPA